MTPNPAPRALVGLSSDVAFPAAEDMQSRFQALFPKIDMSRLSLASVADGVDATYLDSTAQIRVFSDTAPDALGDAAKVIEVTGTGHGDAPESPAELCLLVSLLAATVIDTMDGAHAIWCGVDLAGEGKAFIKAMQGVFAGTFPMESWLRFPVDKRDDGRMTMQTQGMDVFTGGWELSSDFAHPKEDWLLARFTPVAAWVMNAGLPTEDKYRITLKKLGKVTVTRDAANNLILIDPSKTKGAKGRFGLVK
ncbi:MAG: hypothetical protein Alpg2KO_09860 [Alphaproteobacteria bacterium]